MRAAIFIHLTLLTTVFIAGADEILPVLKVGSVTYSNVTVTKVSATDIYFLSNQGMGNVKLKNLDPALQKHLHYDAAKAPVQKSSGNTVYHFRVANASTNAPTKPADIKAELDEATECVKVIINQPVRQLRRTPEMEVSEYSPGWFHAGAETPDFNKVDIRTTQKLDYTRNQYVTSDLNPGIAFVGAELEFNPMTKNFYIDRSLPKKRLTTAEMLEVNRLYHIIGQDKAKLN